jgi:hypothetical protein
LFDQWTNADQTQIYILEFIFICWHTSPICLKCGFVRDELNETGQPGYPTLVVLVCFFYFLFFLSKKKGYIEKVGRSVGRDEVCEGVHYSTGSKSQTTHVWGWCFTFARGCGIHVLGTNRLWVLKIHSLSNPHLLHFILNLKILVVYCRL